MKGPCLGILVALALLCMQSTCIASQVEGTDLGTFVVTAYNIAHESDHPCEDADKILAKGLDNYYCPEFLSDIIMQGSGVDNNNKFIQIDWNGGKKPTTASETFFTYVPYITTKSEQHLEDGVSIAVDPSVIPLNSWVYIESIGWRRADDTGGAIKGKRIDVFMNVLRQEAMNFGKKSLDVMLQAGAQGKSRQESTEASKARSQPTEQATQITLTLYIHEGNASGPVIPGAQITWQDGSGKSLRDTADSNGIVILNGYPGTWSFSASANGYETNSWDQEIAQTCTKHAFLQESAASTFSLNLQKVNAHPNPTIPGSLVMIKVTLSKESADDNDLNVIAVIKSPEGAEISRVAMKRVTGDNFQGIWNANFDVGIYKMNLIASTDKATKTFEDALEIILQKDKGSVIPLKEVASTSQGSESSVIGKWAFHFKRESWESSSEKVTRGPDSKDEWDSTIEFHSDGTFTESTSYTTFSGEWIQNDDTVRLQDNPEFRDESGHYACISEISESRDGRIVENTMHGKGSSITHMTVTGDDPYSAEISETYSWSADRVD